MAASAALAPPTVDVHPERLTESSWHPIFSGIFYIFGSSAACLLISHPSHDLLIESSEKCSNLLTVAGTKRKERNQILNANRAGSFNQKA